MKKPTAEQIEAAAWAAALATEVTTDEVPAGWFTAAELATKLQKSNSTMGKLLLAAVRAGKCDTNKFRVKGSCFVRPVPHYRLK